MSEIIFGIIFLVIIFAAVQFGIEVLGGDNDE